MWVLEQQQRSEAPALPTITSYSLPVGRYEVGRKDKPISIDEKAVSRNHGYVEVKEDGCVVVDNNSTFKTRINGAEIPPKTPYPFASGDILSFGSPHGKADFRARDLCWRLRVPSELVDRASRLGRVVAEDEWPTHLVVTVVDSWALRCVLRGAEALQPAWVDAVLNRRSLSDPLPRDFAADLPPPAELRHKAARVLGGRVIVGDGSTLARLVADLSPESIVDAIDDAPSDARVASIATVHPDVPVVADTLLDSLLHGTHFPTVTIASLRTSPQDDEDDDRTCDDDDDDVKVADDIPAASGWLSTGVPVEEKDEEEPAVSQHSSQAVLFTHKPDEPAETSTRDDLVVDRNPPTKKGTSRRKARDFRKFRKNVVTYATDTVIDFTAEIPAESEADKARRLEREAARKQAERDEACFDDDDDANKTSAAAAKRKRRKL
ncbi:hypothetical protein CTAYLR_005960 [Chrysophaeum taylorii]|uniref:FHA domain-containing protein n=1 Tax=Chrysophaeum taylorii TaxID=2483200 RepID=A0AAD7XS07_9STRA|nr:hypothetical protein CTAYLR_005960 [Chrysophaeum taylorii]